MGIMAIPTFTGSDGRIDKPLSTLSAIKPKELHAMVSGKTPRLLMAINGSAHWPFPGLVNRQELIHSIHIQILKIVPW